MFTLGECKRNNLCVDCENNKCTLAGKILSDCPKYKCDRKGEDFLNCETCEFIKDFQRSMRKRYKESEGLYGLE
jgi:hypothetical protein